MKCIEIFSFDFLWDMIRQGRKITKEKDMGLDQYAHLRNKKIDWEKYYSDDDEEKVKKKQSTFSFGENTQDFKHSSLVSGENRTKPNRKEETYERLRKAKAPYGYNGFKSSRFQRR